MTGRRGLAWAMGIALIGLWSITLRPVTLGGPAMLIGVDGTSMTPTMRDGDLAFTREQGSYQVGDVVAYHVPRGESGAGEDIIHRIVGGDAEHGYEMRGDHNDLDDPVHPHPSDILGKVVFHVPNGSELFQMLTSPQLFAVLIGLCIFLAIVWSDEKRGAPA